MSQAEHFKVSYLYMFKLLYIGEHSYGGMHTESTVFKQLF